MSVACECGIDSDYYFTAADDYSSLVTARRRRCISCAQFIAIGATVLELYRSRAPRSYIEEGIYGDEVPLASKYFCEECADLYLSIVDYGYCVTLDGTSMKECAIEVAEIEKAKSG